MPRRELIMQLPTKYGEIVLAAFQEVVMADLRRRPGFQAGRLEGDQRPMQTQWHGKLETLVCMAWKTALEVFHSYAVPDQVISEEHSALSATAKTRQSLLAGPLVDIGPWYKMAWDRAQARTRLPGPEQRPALAWRRGQPWQRGLPPRQTGGPGEPPSLQASGSARGGQPGLQAGVPGRSPGTEQLYPKPSEAEPPAKSRRMGVAWDIREGKDAGLAPADPAWERVLRARQQGSGLLCYRTHMPVLMPKLRLKAGPHSHFCQLMGATGDS